MADIEKRRSYTPRKVREQRAYRLAVTGGTATAVAAVGFALWAVGVIGATVWVIAAVIAAVSAVLFRRTVNGR